MRKADYEQNFGHIVEKLMVQSSIRSLAETKASQLEKIQLLVGSTSLAHFMEQEKVITTPYLTENQEKGGSKSVFFLFICRVC